MIYYLIQHNDYLQKNKHREKIAVGINQNVLVIKRKTLQLCIISFPNSANLELDFYLSI